MNNHYNFKKFKDKILVTNDFGRYTFLEKNDFKNFVCENLQKESEVYQSLVDNRFIYETPVDVFQDESQIELRGMKNYAFESTSLHIFAITNACNVNCIYCQAKAKESCLNGFMTKETARKAVEIALQSPNEYLTFEIQGGEPLLNFDVVKEIIEYTEQINKDKHVFFTLVSNLVALDNEKLNYLKEKKVSVCTSLDGPRNVQENNRRAKTNGSTFDFAQKGIKLLQMAFLVALYKQQQDFHLIILRKLSIHILI